MSEPQKPAGSTSPPRVIGPWTLHVVETGFLMLDGGSMFGSVPKPIWMKQQPPDERNRIHLAMRCLLLVRPGRVVLIDDGIGDKFAPKLADIYGVEHDRHTLQRSLGALGMEPGDVTDVLLTHLHFDHAGGSTRRDGDRLVPALPKAKYHVQSRNLDNAMQPNPRERASYLPENFEPLREHGVLETWDAQREFDAGVELIPAHGHTRGQQLVRIAGDQGVVYFTADLIPTASHVRIPFVMGYDMAAIETMDEKRALLTRAAAEGAWVLIEHDPSIAWGRPARDGDDFGWAATVAAEPTAAAR